MTARHDPSPPRPVAPQPDLETFSRFAISLLENDAGPLLFERRNGAMRLDRQWKSATDYRTSVDSEIEELIVTKMHQRFPDLGIYGEEGGQQHNSNAARQLVIDSIDGTIAWSRFFGDHYSIALALVESGTPIGSVVHFPHTGATFVAEESKGAWKRERGTSDWERLSVSAEKSLQRSIIVVDHGKELRREAALIIEKLLDNKTGANCVAQYLCASYAMACLAQGRIEGFIGTSVPPEDALAGMFLAKEAGAVVSSLYDDSAWSPTSRSLVVCSSSELLATIRARIRSA